MKNKKPMNPNHIYQVRICTGTLCHVMGGALLPEMKPYLPEYLKEKVQVKGMACADYCKQEDRKPPYVLVDDQLIESASIEKVIAYIKKCENHDSKQ
jgi:NADH:ubiquinone oxidoreductase subunit E